MYGISDTIARLYKSVYVKVGIEIHPLNFHRYIL